MDKRTLRRIDLMNLNNQNIYYSNYNISKIIFLVLISNLLPIFLEQSKAGHATEILTIWTPITILVCIVILIRRSLFMSSRSNIDIHVMNIPVNPLTSAPVDVTAMEYKDSTFDNLSECEDAIGPFAPTPPQNTKIFNTDTQRLINLEKRISRLNSLRNYISSDQEIYKTYMDTVNGIINSYDNSKTHNMEFDGCTDHYNTLAKYTSNIKTYQYQIYNKIYNTIIKDANFNKYNQDIVKELQTMSNNHDLNNNDGAYDCSVLGYSVANPNLHASTVTSIRDTCDTLKPVCQAETIPPVQGGSTNLFTCKNSPNDNSALQNKTVTLFLKKYKMLDYVTKYIDHLNNKVTEADEFGAACTAREKGLGITPHKDTYGNNLN